MVRDRAVQPAIDQRGQGGRRDPDDSVRGSAEGSEYRSVVAPPGGRPAFATGTVHPRCSREGKGLGQTVDLNRMARFVLNHVEHQLDGREKGIFRYVGEIEAQQGALVVVRLCLDLQLAFRAVNAARVLLLDIGVSLGTELNTQNRADRSGAGAPVAFGYTAEREVGADIIPPEAADLPLAGVGPPTKTDLGSFAGSFPIADDVSTLAGGRKGSILAGIFPVTGDQAESSGARGAGVADFAALARVFPDTRFGSARSGVGIPDREDRDSQAEQQEGEREAGGKFSKHGWPLGARE